MDKSAYYNIKKHYEKLSNKEKIIADYFLNHPEIAVSNTITQISGEIAISNATIVRFVRKIGFRSYSEFKISLARETTEEEPQYEQNEHDPISTAINNTLIAIEESKQAFNPKSFNIASELISKADMIYCFGVGGNSVLAFDFYHRFINTGIPCHFNFDFHTQLMLASQTKKNDIAILFDYTGLDKDMLDIAKELTLKGCPIITITCNKKAPINTYSTEQLYVSNSQVPNKLTNTYVERIPMLIIIDILYLEVISMIKERSTEATSHVIAVENTRQL